MIRAIAQLLEKEKVGFILIDGATSAFNREQFCKEFQTQVTSLLEGVEVPRLI